MPMLIKPIDHISIDKQRDVLFVKFDYVPDSLSQDDHECVLEKASPWELMPVRNQLIAFLDSVGIGWCECSGISWSGWVEGYDGSIYIDVPYVLTDPSYCKVASFLEHTDGTSCHPDATWYCLLLSDALKNAHYGQAPSWS